MPITFICAQVVIQNILDQGASSGRCCWLGAGKSLRALMLFRQEGINFLSERYEAGAFVPRDPRRYFRLIAGLGVKIFLLNGGWISRLSAAPLCAPKTSSGAAVGKIDV
jgi:hypothetical protein